ncbi:Gfo/Idh/MocA family oxidoreductase [Campylobacter sp. VicNov18]|uniref:Gfo/Idh/MocA family protein n=1 Tax=Campylobacter bilis TaxID=2691918 RepID=UPI00130DADF7|nr:Gfo/Idh/MocA family oxidoreductase [Campylobacter bilis]MPV64158.1 gfo/Idh/MocA family oxidoreductase [Campylobacter hepaticus]MBM0637661.1 gfo/Idh/MocA family oxidoreductase [Campylobacter bilis]MCC8278386.1 Gfo/Idh/MocA family oxidoreductase [Campylobacter bilis]MCC8299889.1 Gfo/Idh/MocA family oxidoreductase [Campylobacter bilis]MCC8301295.1 Gfo/Idh/MocA family oxidoreductase [Campylobacter bilis]
MTIGIIGLGKMGQNHLNELAKNPHFQINALYDLKQNHTLNYPFFDNLNDFLKQKSDIIIIATPTNSHLELAKEVFAHSKTVLIEKPLALNLEQITAISQLAKKHEVKLAVGFCERFNPAILSLKKDLASQKIISINIQRFSPYPQRITDIGILQDLSVHDLDLLSFLSDQKIIDAKLLAKSTKNPAMYSESILLCQLENSIATIHQSWNSTQKLRKIHLITQDHFYQADLNDFSLLKDAKSISTPHHTPLFAQHQALLSLATNQSHHLANANDAYKVQEILERFI